MEIPFRSFLPSRGVSIDDEVHPVLFHVITLLIPVNIYIIGDWMGTGIQWALLRYQDTYLGRNVISIFTDSGYIVQGIFHGRTALSTGVWSLGALLLVLDLLITLILDREKSKRIRGYLLISGSLLFLLSNVIQYGILFHGPAGIVIPIGIPALLVMGLILLRPTGKRSVSGKKGPLLSRRTKEVLLLFLVCFLVYNTSTFIRMSGDTTPAQIIPLNLLKYGEISFDRFFPDFNNPSNLYAFVNIQGHYYSYFPIVTPILITPLYIIPYILISVAGTPLNIGLIASLARFASAIVAATGVVIVYLNAQALFSKTSVYLTTITYAFGTATWAISSQALWQQGMIELLLALLIFTIIRNEAREAGWHLMVLGILSGLLAMARPPDALLLIPVLLYILWHHRQKAHLYFIPGILSAFPFILYNFLVFGSPLGGYEKTAALMGISTAIPIRFLGYLFAPNMGFFIFSPILIFGLAGYFRTADIRNLRLQEILALYGPTLILSIVGYSFYADWAGAAYGPRYLTGFLPVYILYVGLFLDHILRDSKGWKKSTVIAAFGLLLLLSVGIQVIGAFYYPFVTDVNMDDRRVWDPHDLLILRSYQDGADRIDVLRVNTMPPLPPLFTMDLRSRQVYPFLREVSPGGMVMFPGRNLSRSHG
jgi:hypothetical protein